MKKIRSAVSGGFTLVELLIVISLIAILSVAVLATINPIEQANKAKDASVQNDAAEVLNAYERYYANSQEYPWMQQGDAALITVDTALITRSDTYGFGICGGGVGVTGATYDSVATCSTATTTTQGLLVEGDELKPSFAGKSEFQTVGTSAENGLWTYKATSSGGSIYVCYVPKAKSNRQQTDKLYCLDDTNDTICKAGTTGVCRAATACVALAVTDDGWSTPTLDDGATAMFRCVPE